MEYLSFPGLGLDKLPINDTAFTVLGLEVKWYGILIVFGMILAYIIAGNRAKYEGIKSDDMYDVMLWTVVIGVIGARLYYVVFKPGDFFVTDGGLWHNIKESFLNIINLRSGGLAIYGGVIFGILAIALVARHKKIRLPVMLDVAAPAVMIGQVMGRWGNFMNIEAYGRQTTLPWRMCSESIASEMWIKGYVNEEGYSQIIRGTLGVHPTFFYESMWNLTGLILVMVFYKKKRFNGQVALFYGAWYGLGRAMIEGLRTDSLMLGSIRVSQLLAVMCLVVCTTLFILFTVKTPAKLRLVCANADESDADTATEDKTSDDDGSDTVADNNESEDTNNGKVD